MRILRYLRYSKCALLCVLCLLVVQSFCDLALPNLTSRIVDVGIQQSGVEHVAVDEMSASTYESISALLDEGDGELFLQSYEPTDNSTYALTRYGRDNIAQLDEVLALPLIAVRTPSLLPEIDASALKADLESGTLDRSAVTEIMEEAARNLEAEGALVEQQGIAAAGEEYRALGYDMAAMQLTYVLRTGAIMLGVAAVGMLAAACTGFVAARTGTKIARKLRIQLFERVVSFSEMEVGSFSAASLITRATNDIQLIQMILIMMMRMILYAPILAIGGIVMIMATSPSMGWIVVVAVVFIFVLVGILFKVSMPKFKMMQKLIDRVNLVAREILTGLPVIRAFDRDDFEEDRFDKASQRLMDTQLYTNRVMTFMMPTMMLVMNVVSVAIVWFGGHFVDAGTLQTGDLIAFITYAMVIIMSFLMLGMISIMLPRADVAAQRVDEVLSCEPSVSDKVSVSQASGKNSNPGACIAFEDVCFSYGDAEGMVLDHVSFVAEAGKTTAVVGSTGSGKSTLLKLIERFYDVDSGSVTLDGIDVREMTQHDLRSQLGYVPQFAFLFSGTVESNIAYANESMGEKRVRKAADIAQATSFILEDERGFDREIAQGGTNVSGGQRQRLAIARALACDARAYLFDDSFSALDYKTDAALRHELSSSLSGRTVIIVAQRISTVLSADRIVVLDEGRVVGCGTHDELMETCVEYKEIALSQLSESELRGGDAA